MPEVQMFQPTPSALATMFATPRMHIAPTMLATQQGLDGHLGPEAAGAILMLQAGFTHEDRAAKFWDAAAELMTLLADAPGFIRRYSFPDGLSMTLLAFWRTADDARRFAATPEHRAAVRKLYAERWQYSHFSAIWEMTKPHDRMIFCEDCDAITPVSAGACNTCGAELVDIYRSAQPSASL